MFNCLTPGCFHKLLGAFLGRDSRGSFSHQFDNPTLSVFPCISLDSDRNSVSIRLRQPSSKNKATLRGRSSHAPPHSLRSETAPCGNGSAHRGEGSYGF